MEDDGGGRFGNRRVLLEKQRRFCPQEQKGRNAVGDGAPQGWNHIRDGWNHIRDALIERDRDGWNDIRAAGSKLHCVSVRTASNVTALADDLRVH